MTHPILSETKASILWIEERERKDIIVCAPHHTLGGIKNMPCPEHTDGDENTGFIALKIAEKLNLSSIIACNYTFDPNKSLKTDYSTQIIKWNPKFLIEIHGHGARKIKDSKIEISSGSLDRNDISKVFSQKLSEYLNNIDALKSYVVDGDFNNIHFKATNTATVTHKVWTSFHIELPPSIRLDEQNKLPTYIDEFVNCITKTIKEICK